MKMLSMTAAGAALAAALALLPATEAGAEVRVRVSAGGHGYHGKTVRRAPPYAYRPRAGHPRHHGGRRTGWFGAWRAPAYPFHGPARHRGWAPRGGRGPHAAFRGHPRMFYGDPPRRGHGDGLVPGRGRGDGHPGGRGRGGDRRGHAR